MMSVWVECHVDGGGIRVECHVAPAAPCCVFSAGIFRSCKHPNAPAGSRGQGSPLHLRGRGGLRAEGIFRDLSFHFRCLAVRRVSGSHEMEGRGSRKEILLQVTNPLPCQRTDKLSTASLPETISASVEAAQTFRHGRPQSQFSTYANHVPGGRGGVPKDFAVETAT